MPLIPWNPYENDFWYNEILTEIQDSLDRGDRDGAPSGSHVATTSTSSPSPSESGEIRRLLADPSEVADRQPRRARAQRSNAIAAGLGQVPPTPPDFARRHYLGTDSQGRDVASRLLYGFRISIFFALFLVFFGQVIGTLIGSLQGYLGGRFDIISQRVIEMLISIPFLYVVIIMAALVAADASGCCWRSWRCSSGSPSRSTCARRCTGRRRANTAWPRSLTARRTCASSSGICCRIRLTPLVTFTPFAIVAAIFALTGLDYLGYGLPAPTPSWGELIDQALETENRDKLWLTLAPFGALTITLVLVVFIGESIREAFDPEAIREV